ncbi:Alg9-like mannosyltransferase family-domain-containing protein [Dissophora ornata]|nr:Alg9-like mannosyltransferase family-domain-containing protein [Dissophora ornata]
MHQHRPFSKATWNIYLFLLAVRVFIAVSPGYIHPDEFFQSAEITAGNIFHIDVNIPWEYKPELPCRSILIPAITTGIPYLLLKILTGSNSDHYVTTRALFLTQRLAFVLMSLIIDWAVVRMARQIRRSPSIALLLVSTSYVTLAYHTHPFSNTVESTILALCAVVLGTIIKEHDSSITTTSPTSSTSGTSATTPTARPTFTTTPETTSTILSFGLGVLFSAGIFTRITFVLYGFPLGVMFLYLNARASFTQGRSLVAGLRHFILACVPLALGLGLMSAFAIIIDSIYFNKLVIFNKTNGVPLSLLQLLFTSPKDWLSLSYKGSLTVTMFNNLRYNMDEKNLAEHGLHPRFFHLLLNFPVLFGNLALIAVTTIAQKIMAGQWKSESKLVTALTYSGICGISFLSAMPHQEARFLTPLILPLVISLSGRISKLGRKFWPLWLLANGVMAIIFGLAHQSGLVPAMGLIQHQTLGSQDCKEVSSAGNHILCLTYPSQQGLFHVNDGNIYTTHVVFYKTYMPPRHLLGYNASAAESHGVKLTVSDWRGKSQTEVLSDLSDVKTTSASVDKALLKSAKEQRGQRAVLFRKTGPSQYERTILVAPATVDFSDEEFHETRDEFAWHANFDQIDVVLRNPLTSLYLNVFYV